MSETQAPRETIAPRVEFDALVLQQIRKHARSSMEAEICGVLIGRGEDGVTRVEACIVGEGASQGGAHVTFTQATWEHIYRVKDAKYPDQVIVGWYHSHPGFGVFLSDYDLFIHENFFGAPHQIAWVFDPHSDEEGCFGWVDKKVEPLSRITVQRQSGDAPAVGIAEPDPRRESSESASKPQTEKSIAQMLLKAAVQGAALMAAFLICLQFVGGGRERHPQQPELPIKVPPGNPQNGSAAPAPGSDLTPQIVRRISPGQPGSIQPPSAAPAPPAAPTEPAAPSASAVPSPVTPAVPAAVQPQQPQQPQLQLPAASAPGVPAPQPPAAPESAALQPAPPAPQTGITPPPAAPQEAPIP